LFGLIRAGVKLKRWKNREKQGKNSGKTGKTLGKGGANPI